MTTHNERVKALDSLRPGAEWSMSMGEIVYWAETNTDPAPTTEELDVEVERLKALPEEKPVDLHAEIAALKKALLDKGTLTVQDVATAEAATVDMVAEKV